MQPVPQMLSAPPEARILLTARGVRAVADGLVSLVLPAYLLALGYGPFETGIIATATEVEPLDLDRALHPYADSVAHHQAREFRAVDEDQALGNATDEALR